MGTPSMTTGSIRRVAAAALFCGVALLASPAARAADTITAGAVGSGSTTIWPIYIGIQNGFFDAVGIKIDPVFAPSSTAIAQQVAAGGHITDRVVFEQVVTLFVDQGLEG